MQLSEIRYIEMLKTSNNINRRHAFCHPSFLSTKRMRHIFFIALIISTFIFFLNVKRSAELKYFQFMCAYIKLAEDHNYCDDSYADGETFTIETDGCTIPLLKPVDNKIKNYIEYPKVPRCANTSSILARNQTHIWVKRDKQFNKNNTLCCYRSFYRPLSVENVERYVDDRVKYNDCIDFNDTIDVHDEFVKVNCTVKNGVYEEYFLFAPKKKFTARNDIEDNKENKMAFNVLILGIDSVSRLNFYRTMPKTVKFLLDNGAIDLAGYNKVGDNTFPNLIPMLMGISDSEIKSTCLPHKDAKFDNCPFIWEWFKQAGFFTALAEDNSWLGTFNFNRAGFISSPTDYYARTFMDQAEKYAAKENFTKAMPLCLNDKYFYQVLLDYIQDLTHTLRDTKLFGVFWEVTMSHDDLNYPMVMDDDYSKLFQNLKMSGYLNTSIIFVLSDHGIRWGNIRYTKQGRLEERLPFVFILLPQIFKEKYNRAYQNLQTNSKRLTTPYDIYFTLNDLTNLDEVKNESIHRRSGESYSKNRGISLFLPVPSNRTCEMAGISDHWCTCNKRVVKSKRNKLVWRAATALVDQLNTRVSVYKKCARLSLSDVIEANEMVVGSKEDEESDSWRELMLVVKTSPGDAVFEATLRGDHNKGWMVVGTVSRLNLYGNQSHCITDNLLKLYCYCK